MIPPYFREKLYLLCSRYRSKYRNRRRSSSSSSAGGKEEENDGNGVVKKVELEKKKASSILNSIFNRSHCFKVLYFANTLYIGGG